MDLPYICNVTGVNYGVSPLNNIYFTDICGKGERFWGDIILSIAKNGIQRAAIE